MSDRIHENTVLLVDDDQPIREERCGNLRRRLASREIVDRAKLTIMEERGLSEEDAYVLIRELSRRKNLSMEQVAHSLLERGGGPL